MMLVPADAAARFSQEEDESVKALGQGNSICEMTQPRDYAALRAILGGGEHDDDAEAMLSKLRPLLLADARSDRSLGRPPPFDGQSATPPIPAP